MVMVMDAIHEIELELFESQNEIIRLQSGAINDLILLLSQHASVDENEFRPIKEKIDHAAMIRAEMSL